MTKDELAEFNSYKDVDERSAYINTLREKHSKDLKDQVTYDLIDKIIEKGEERGSLLVEIQAAQGLLNALENMLDSNVGATTETIQRLLDKIESIEKDFNTRFDSKTKLKSKQVETLAKTKERVQKSLRGELSDLNILADTVRDIKDNLAQLRSIDQDLSKQIKYYESLIVRYGDRINEDAVYDLIDKAEKKAGFVKKMITALLNILAKARKLLAGHVSSFEKANTAYETALKDSNFKDVSESELRSMLNSSDPLQRNKADAYFDMRRHIEALENVVIETIDTAENAEQQLSEQESRLQDNVKAYDKYLNQIRYLEELLTDTIGKADDITLSQPIPVTPKGPAPVSTTETKTFGRKDNNTPFITRNGANSQLARVAKETNIPVESLIVVQDASGKGFVIIDSGKRAVAPKPEVTVQGDQVDTASTPLPTEEQSLIESEKAASNIFTIATSKEFTEAKNKLENAKTRKEANNIYKEAVEKLDPTEVESLKIVYRDNESKWATLKAAVVTPLTLDQLKVGMIIGSIDYKDSFKIVSKVDGIYTAQNINDKNISVTLTDKNIKSFIRQEDMGKKEAVTVKPEVIVTEESKANLIQNKDNVAIFISNVAELSKLNELAAKAELKKIEEDLLNNIDC
jgi:hypothetical protein